MSIFLQGSIIKDFTNLNGIGTQSSPTKSVFKIPGKCLSNKIEFYNAGSIQSGNIYNFPKYLTFYRGKDFFGSEKLIPEPEIIQSPIFPYNQELYSGQLVQLSSEFNGNSYEVKVIPYQTGRGIPQNNRQSVFFSDDTFTITWDDIFNVDSVLSVGVISGNNNSCFGCVIDTDTENNKVFDSSSSHISPFSDETSTEFYGIDEPVPVMSRGLTTLLIGAASNIGSTAYYTPTVEEGDDPRILTDIYTAVPYIPLFSGEVINVGSEIYVSCMGHQIEPYPTGKSPYPTPAYSDASNHVDFTEVTIPGFDFYEGIQRRGLDSDPWYDWYDATYGLTGWTSTPHFTNIGTNQGTIIVNGKTITQDNRKPLFSEAEYFTTTFGNAETKLSKFPAISERSLSIGRTVQQISGTGSWNYTGTIGDFDFTNSNTHQGIGYINGTTYSITGGSGTGQTVQVISIDSVGGILTLEGFDASSRGYLDGDIVTINHNLELPKASYTLTLNVSGNEDGYTYITPTLPTFEDYIEGWSYRNSLNIQVTVETSVYQRDITATAVTSVETFSVQTLEFDNYPLGTLLYLYKDGINIDDMAIVEVTTNNFLDTITVTLVKNGSKNAYIDGEVCRTLIKNSNYRFYINSGIIKLQELPNNYPLTDTVNIGDYVFDVDFNTGLTLNPKLIKGGYGYQFNDDYYADQGIFNNNAIGPQSQNVLIGAVTNQLALSKVIMPYGYQVNNLWGTTQTITQTPPINIDDQPGAGAIPATGWESNLTFSNATFFQDIDLEIINTGSGNTPSANVSVIPGTMLIDILAVDDNGGVLKIRNATYTTDYSNGDIISFGNGAQARVSAPISEETIREVVSYAPYLTANNGLVKKMIFTLTIENGGSGYVDGITTVTSMNRPGVDMTISLVTDGGVIIYASIVDWGNLGYSLGDSIVPDGGNIDAVIRLKRPKKSFSYQFTNQGSGYVSATGVSTYNFTQNNLYVICEVTGGQCLVQNYSVFDKKPPGWDVTRYSPNDVLALIQGVNESATFTAVSVTNETTFFVQGNNGVGYTSTDAYAFFPTVNTSKTPTTVDIVAENGNIVEVTINTLGDDVRLGDKLLIEAGDNNAVIELIVDRDIPPQWQNEINGRNPTHDEWNDYASNLQTAVNLINYPCLVDVQQNYPNYYNNSYYFYGDPDNKESEDIGNYITT